jgi:xanthine dehydrogenase accessory factor
VIETQRGHSLGRVIWQGQTQPDSKLPDGDVRRVLRAPANGNIVAKKSIGDFCKENEIIASVGEKTIVSPFDGILRGLIHPAVDITEGMKIGDVDARNDVDLIRYVSDKALAVAGGVMEVVLMKLKEMENNFI